MTTGTKPAVQDRGPAKATRGPARRSDEPYASILDEDVDLSVELAGSITPGRLRARRISREEVFSTADDLLVEGVRPTIDRVRMRLGRGSTNTINEFMDAWWAKLGSRLSDLPGKEFPQLPERVSASLTRLWNEALDAAHEALQVSVARREEALTDEARALHAQQELFERERLAQMARAAALEESVQLARAQLDEANQRARALEQLFSQCHLALEQCRAELATAATVRRQLDARVEAATSHAGTQRARKSAPRSAKKSSKAVKRGVKRAAQQA